MNVKSLSLLVILFTLLPSLCKEIEPELPILKSALEKRNLYGSVITHVTQKKTLPSLSQPLITKGKLWLIPQTAFRWEQGSPATEVAIFTHNTVSLLNETHKTISLHNAKDKAVSPLMLLLGMGKHSSYKNIMDNFKVLSVDHSKHLYTVTFKPDSGKMRRVVSQFILSINLKTSFPKEIKWIQKDGAITSTSFLSPQFNAPIPQKIFLFNAKNYTKAK